MQIHCSTTNYQFVCLFLLLLFLFVCLFVFDRVLGSLLSAHLLVMDPSKPFGMLSPTNYNGELLDLARDLATRILPAFETSITGLPHPRVSGLHCWFLRYTTEEEEEEGGGGGGGGGGGKRERERGGDGNDCQYELWYDITMLIHCVANGRE